MALFKLRSTVNITTGGPETPDLGFCCFMSAGTEDTITALWPYRHMLWIGLLLLRYAPRFYNTLKSTAFSRAYQMPYSILAVHVAVSFVDLVKYHGQVWLDGGAGHRASAADVVLCAVQCWTSLYITAQHHLLPKAAMEITRATFHCMSAQRLLATGLAVYTGSPRWHEASVMLLNNFLFARVLIGMTMGRFSWKQRYATGIVGSHLLGLYNGDYPHGIAIYCGLMLVLLNIDGWAKGRDNFKARTLRYLGLATPADWYVKMESISASKSSTPPSKPEPLPIPTL